MTEFVIAYSLQWELGGSMRHLKGGKGGEKEKEKGRKEKEKRGKGDQKRGRVSVFIWGEQ
jgi:hypothetical protein